jgi:hypothetical protein
VDGAKHRPESTALVLNQDRKIKQQSVSESLYLLSQHELDKEQLATHILFPAKICPAK